MNSKLFVVLMATLLLCGQGLALYSSTSKVVHLTKDNFTSKVINDKDSLWLVEFYAPWCGHCKNLAPEWEKAAKALEGYFNVGAVDMTTDQEAGASYKVEGYPTLKYFGADKQNPDDYSGGRTAAEIVSFALQQIKKKAMQRIGVKPSDKPKSEAKKEDSKKEEAGSDSEDGDVIVLTDENFDLTVYMDNKDYWFIEFYAPWCGHCKTLAPIWKKVATEFKGSNVKIAKVDATKNSELGKRFEVKGYPSLKFLPIGSSKDSEAISYDGGREFKPLVDYAKEQRDKNKPLVVTQLASQSVFERDCVEFKGVCVIGFLPNLYDSTADQRVEYLEILKDEMKSNRQKPFNFLWAEGGHHLTFENQFGVGGSGYPSLLAISTNKKISSVMRGAFTSENVKLFVE